MHPIALTPSPNLSPGLREEIRMIEGFVRLIAVTSPAAARGLLSSSAQAAAPVVVRVAMRRPSTATPPCDWDVRPGNR